jgi:hypothetical protein
MADEELPGVIETLTRDEYRDLWLQDYKLFVPNADVGPGTQPYVDASLAADSTQILVNDAIVIGNGTNLDDSEGRWLLQIGESEGVFKLPPAGGSGYIVITTAAGGSTIFQGDQVREPLSGLRFQVLQTSVYAAGALDRRHRHRRGNEPLRGHDRGVHLAAAGVLADRHGLRAEQRRGPHGRAWC